MNIFGLGLPELIVIALILLLFFGSKRLPSLFRSIGTSINELKTGLNEGDTTAKNDSADEAQVVDKTSDKSTEENGRTKSL